MQAIFAIAITLIDKKKYLLPPVLNNTIKPKLLPSPSCPRSRLRLQIEALYWYICISGEVVFSIWQHAFNKCLYGILSLLVNKN